MLPLISRYNDLEQLHRTLLRSYEQLQGAEQQRGETRRAGGDAAGGFVGGAARRGQHVSFAQDSFSSGSSSSSGAEGDRVHFEGGTYEPSIGIAGDTGDLDTSGIATSTPRRFGISNQSHDGDNQSEAMALVSLYQERAEQFEHEAADLKARLHESQTIERECREKYATLPSSISILCYCIVCHIIG